METVKRFIKCSRCATSFEVQTVDVLSNGSSLGVDKPFIGKAAVPTLMYFGYERLYLCDKCHREFYDWFIRKDEKDDSKENNKIG